MNSHFLPGSRFSKTALAQLFERVIMRSRTIFQMAMLYLQVVGHKCICACIVWLTDVLSKLFGINLVIEESKLSEKTKSFLIKIQRIERISAVDVKTIETSVSSTVTDSSAEISLPSPLLLSAIDKSPKASKSSGLLILCVYGSATFVYAQFFVLIYGLNSTYAPPGLVFLVLSLAYIGYIILKVSIYQMLGLTKLLNLGCVINGLCHYINYICK